MLRNWTCYIYLRCKIEFKKCTIYLLKSQIERSELFDDLGVDFVSINDSIDTSTAMGKFFFRTMASIAELERDIISERTKSGLQAARSSGRKGGRSTKKKDKGEMAIKMYKSKDYTINQIKGGALQ